ncbi:helix-turn-helix DNA binding domain protein [Rhodococcus phage Reynauld]|uniref:Helix-turn-helix DNA binding domain protein n=1 Tax=Rhodococcus phage Reynauld TaxID=3062845 RepID=A0ACD4UH95_9CAUD|nr:helix-turn-helix DNA binding domain protein [Rhodococcus phage Reynauld]
MKKIGAEHRTPREIKTPDDLPVMCLVDEVAQFFRADHKAVRKWVKEGVFPGACKPGRNILIPRQAVLDYAQSKYGAPEE